MLDIASALKTKLLELIIQFKQSRIVEIDTLAAKRREKIDRYQKKLSLNSHGEYFLFNFELVLDQLKQKKNNLRLFPNDD